MGPAAADITERELREAFNRSGLWRRGWSYQRAIEATPVLTSLIATIRAMRGKEQQQHGKPAPVQRALI